MLLAELLWKQVDISRMARRASMLLTCRQERTLNSLLVEMRILLQHLTSHAAYERSKRPCIYTHLSTTAVSPFQYCFTMSWWVGGSLREFQCCTTYCCTAVVLLYCCCTGLWVGRSVLSCRVLLSCVHTGSWVCLFLFLPLYRPRAGIVKRAASDYYHPPTMTS